MSAAKALIKNAKFKATRANDQQRGGLRDAACDILRKSDTALFWGLLSIKMGTRLLLQLSKSQQPRLQRHVLRCAYGGVCVPL